MASARRQSCPQWTLFADPKSKHGDEDPMELYINRLSAPCRAVWMYLLQVRNSNKKNLRPKFFLTIRVFLVELRHTGICLEILNLPPVSYIATLMEGILTDQNFNNTIVY